MNKSTQPLPLHWDYPRISPNLPSRIMCVVGGLYCVYEDFDISWFLYKMGNHEICWNINHVLGPPTYRHFLPLHNVTNEGKWVFVTDLHFVIFFSCLLQGQLGIGNCWRVDGNVGWLRDINIFRDFLSCITRLISFLFITCLEWAEERERERRCGGGKTERERERERERGEYFPT